MSQLNLHTIGAGSR